MQAAEDTVIPQSETTFDVTKDDEETKPNFTKPIISVMHQTFTTSK